MSPLPAELSTRVGQRQSLRLDPWTLGAFVVALAVAMPALVIAGMSLSPAGAMWTDLAATVILAILPPLGSFTTSAKTPTRWSTSTAIPSTPR